MRFLFKPLTTAFSKKPALTALLLLTAIPAQAETLTLLSVDGVTSNIGAAKNTILEINHLGTPGNSFKPVIAGLFGVKVDDEYLQGFCLEPHQNIYLNTPYPFSPVSVDTAYSPKTAGDIGRLLTKYGSLPLDPLNSAALQISLWEITGDGSGAYDLTSGNFSIMGTGVSQPGSFTDSQAIDLAGSWLSNLGKANNVTVTVHQNASTQDIITWTGAAVPDGGSTLALSGISLLGLAGVQKILRNRQKA